MCSGNRSIKSRCLSFGLDYMFFLIYYENEYTHYERLNLQPVCKPILENLGF